MKILAGYEPISAGVIRIDGEERSWHFSREAEQAGIVLIHQELNLAEHLDPDPEPLPRP